jgi:hypothetical protein
MVVAKWGDGSIEMRTDDGTKVFPPDKWQKETDSEGAR